MKEQTQELMQKLMLENPYVGFSAEAHPEDLQGWNSFHPNFNHMLAKHRPSTVIEVGTWKGASALNMASIAQNLGLDCTFVCVDTWLGSIEHRRYDIYYPSLRVEHGYPRLYQTFLGNVVRNGFQDRILPFPLASTAAGRWMKEREVTADLVFLDGSHDAEDVFIDLSVWFDIVKPGGAIFGDDFSYPSVDRAIHLFAALNEVVARPLDSVQWVIDKTHDRPAVQPIDLIERAAQ